LSTVRMDHFRQSDLRKTRPDPCTFCLSQCTSSGGRERDGRALDRHLLQPYPRSNPPERRSHEFLVRRGSLPDRLRRRETAGYTRSLGLCEALALAKPY
jgi:hypothetical protein